MVGLVLYHHPPTMNYVILTFKLISLSSLSLSLSLFISLSLFVGLSFFLPALSQSFSFYISIRTKHTNYIFFLFLWRILLFFKLYNTTFYSAFLFFPCMVFVFSLCHTDILSFSLKFSPFYI